MTHLSYLHAQDENGNSVEITKIMPDYEEEAERFGISDYEESYLVVWTKWDEVSHLFKSEARYLSIKDFMEMMSLGYREYLNRLEEDKYLDKIEQDLFRNDPCLDKMDLYTTDTEKYHVEPVDENWKEVGYIFDSKVYERKR